MSKPLGDTEKTMLVGALILAGWLGLDAFIQRAEKRRKESAGNETDPTSTAMRRAQIARSRRRRRAV